MSKPARVAIGKKVRFEVFKRDGFKCQYCGKSAPDVVLHVDHIDPVSAGGSGDIMNLVTACIDCNLGKSDRALDDASVVERQRKQLQDLNERREQIEMMLSWRNALQEMDEDIVDLIVNAMDQAMGNSSVNDSGKVHIRKWLKKFSVEEILSSIDKSAARYLRVGQEDNQGFFDCIPKWAATERKPEAERRVLYVVGILRNRLSYVNFPAAKSLIRGAVYVGYSIEDITEFAKQVKNWTAFRDYMESIQNG